jgi:hypothetical protein
MRNAAATGRAAHPGMPFMRAYIHAPNASNNHPAPSAPASPARVPRPGEFGIAVMIALACLAPLQAKDPPPDLARRVAHRESETAEERRQYAYTQSVRLQEIDGRGTQTGDYREIREVIFSPTGDRTERFSGEPVSRLKNLVMTPEDFADLRNIQPFVLTEDLIRIYEVEYKGEERINGNDCWVLAIRPRQILSGQRLFDGMLWARQDDFSVIRSEGKAVPQIVTTKQENLFPHFTTIRKQVNGFWFPAITSADDTLYFRNAPIREKLVVRYDDYKKFGSDTTVTFEK